MSLHSSLKYMECNLRTAFPLVLKKYRLSNNLSQNQLAGILMDKKVKSEKEYVKHLEKWKKKISNWENGLSLPSLQTFFYLVSILGNDVCFDTMKNNKFLEDFSIKS